MLWYQRSPGDTALKLVGFLYFETPTVEEMYKNDFAISGNLAGDAAKNGSLKIDASEAKHGAVYYCAAREAQQRESSAYFTKTARCFFTAGGL